MAVDRTITENIQRESPEIEAWKLGMLAAGKKIADQPIDYSAYGADQKVADFDPQEQGVYDYIKGAGTGGSGGIGGYAPTLTTGRSTLAGGLTTLGSARGMLQQGQTALGLGAGQYAGGPGYTAGQFAGGPGYTAGQFAGGPGYTAGQFAGGPGYTAEGFDPTSVSQYMNPYEDAVVQQALADVQRSGDIAQTQADAQGVASGAFGGSRQGVQRAEMGRNLLDTQARTAAGLRSSGYQSAMAQAQQAFMDQQRRAQGEAQFRTQSGQQAFENAQRRAQAEAQFRTQSGQQAFEDQQRRAQAQAQFGTQSQQQAFENQQRRAQAQAQFGTTTGLQAFEDQQRRAQAEAQFRTQSGQQAFEAAKQRQMGIGSGIASMAGQMAGIGTQQAGIGAQQLGAAQQMQSMKLRDLGLQQQMGQQQRGLAQARLDAQRANALKQLYEPYGRISWLGDIYKGAPSSQSTLGSMQAPSPPSPSMFQQVAGFGTGLLGTAAAAKQFGGLF